MTFAASLIVAVAPSLVLAWYFYSLDPNPGRRHAVVWAFVLGFLTVFPVMVVQVPLLDACKAIPSPYVRGAARSFIVVAGTEEFFKFVVLVLFCARNKEFHGPMDGMVYGAVASLGFATVENIGYVYIFGLVSAWARAFSAVPCHAFCGAIMGYYLGRARFSESGRARLLLKSFAVPLLLHGLYDFPALTILAKYDIAIVELSQADLPLLLLALVLMPGVLIFMWVWTLRIHWRLGQKSEPAAPLNILSGSVAAPELLETSSHTSTLSPKP
jgi:RsiW-degrading membrane proteinase PrsW (M82 family)